MAEKKIVHRDLAIRNILLGYEERGYVAKVGGESILFLFFICVKNIDEGEIFFRFWVGKRNYNHKLLHCKARNFE